ncbi:immunoglobulin domain-containing protein, partial [Salmonella sp. s58724]|uniref:immunoglobulin domain-containing protein n=1 Tax=Salmonella sp. s58724 TaxID=3159706 RepID=UPI0039804C9D
ESVILMKGEALELICSTSNINHDFHLMWSFPSGANALESHASHILPGSWGYKRSSTLWISSAEPSDSGKYRCQAQNEKGVSSSTIRLDVYDC